MSAHSMRRRLLLSGAALVGALSGYGRSAYAQQVCVLQSGTTYLCAGSSDDTQDLTNIDDATVTTGLNFDVDTTVGGGSGGNAIIITGDGALSYTDANTSPLTGETNALYIRSNGDVGGGNPGSVTVNTNGTLIGGDDGIRARNFGSGALDIEANGDVTGTNLIGIYARNDNGTDLTVTTGVDTTIIGGLYGIRARYGSDATTVTANGDVTGTDRSGIYARNNSGALTVTTGVDTTVTGGTYGIRVRGFGSGATTITAADTPDDEELFGDVTVIPRGCIRARKTLR